MKDKRKKNTWVRTSVQELNGVSGRRRFAEGLGSDGQDSEGVTDSFGQSADGESGVLQT